jgi:hypothetical protein
LDISDVIRSLSFLTISKLSVSDPFPITNHFYRYRLNGVRNWAASNRRHCLRFRWFQLWFHREFPSWRGIPCLPSAPFRFLTVMIFVPGFRNVILSVRKVGPCIVFGATAGLWSPSSVWICCRSLAIWAW